jgi:hypothetical protein
MTGHIESDTLKDRRNLNTSGAPITHAILADCLMGIERVASRYLAAEVMGMWNPHFCSADATFEAGRACEELRHRLADLERRTMLAAAPAPPKEEG